MAVKNYQVVVSQVPAMSGTCSVDGCKDWGNWMVSLKEYEVAATACCEDHTLPAAINLCRRTVRAKTFTVGTVRLRSVTYIDTIATSEVIRISSLTNDR